MNKRVSLIYIITLLLVCLFPVFALAQEFKLYDVEYDSINKTIIIKTSKEVKTETFNLENPPRTVVDLPMTVYQPVAKKIEVNDGIIKQIRVSQYKTKTKDSDSPSVSRISIEMVENTEFEVRNAIEDEIQVIKMVSLKTNSKPIVISNESLDKYSSKNKLDLIEYSKNKLLISAKDKFNYELTKDDEPFTYNLKLNNFTLNGLKDIPLKQEQNIESITVKEKNHTTFLKIKVKNNFKLKITLPQDNKLELYANNDISASTNPENTSSETSSPKNDNFLELNLNENEREKVVKVSISTIKSGMKYRIFQLSDPERLVLDTYGTNISTFKDPSLGKYSNLIQRIRFGYLDKTQEQTLDGVRIVFELKKKVLFKENAINEKTLELVLNSDPNDITVAAPTINNTGKVIVVVDAGHGGNDPGAIGVGGVKEKEITLSVSFFLRKLLTENNILVLMPRSDDTEVLLQPRVDLANNNKADLFVSVHCNSLDGTGPKGIETYYRTPQSLDFAKTIHKNMVENLGALDRGVRERNLFVTRKSVMPSVLVEIGYISNPSEGALLGTVEYQKKVAKALYKGIKEYLSKQTKT